MYGTDSAVIEWAELIAKPIRPQHDLATRNPWRVPDESSEHIIVDKECLRDIEDARESEDEPTTSYSALRQELGLG